MCASNDSLQCHGGGFHRGSTTVFIAVTLSGILGLSAFVIDAAGAYATAARLQNFVDAGVDAGATRLSDRMVELAMVREPNPPEGADPRDYLTEADRQTILVDPSIGETVRDYIERNRVPYEIILDAVEVSYPVNQTICTEAVPQNVEVRATVRKNQSFILGRILNGNEATGLTASSIRSVRLCPNP